MRPLLRSMCTEGLTRTLLLPALISMACAEPSEPHPCAIPGEEGEVVVCEGGATALAADATSLYWVSGVDFSGWRSSIDCERVNCAAPALYSLSHEGGEPDTLAMLEGTPRALDLGPTIIVSTSAGLWEIGYRGGVTPLGGTGPPGSISTFATRDGSLWRAQDREILRGNLPTAVAPPPHTVVTDDEPILALAVSDELLVWTTFVHPEDEAWTRRTLFAQRTDEPGSEVFSLADDLGLVSDLAIDAHHVVWRDTNERVWSRDLRTDAPAVLLAEHVTAFAVHDGALYHGRRRGVHNVALESVPLSGGPSTTLVTYETEKVFWLPSVAIHDGYVYWSDTRIMRKPLD